MILAFADVRILNLILIIGFWSAKNVANYFNIFHAM